MESTLPIQLGTTHRLVELRRTSTGRVLLAICASVFVALAAHVSLPLYFTPVPITLQTLAVLLVGLSLGPELGFWSMILYLGEGAAGAPVFTPHGLGGVAQLLGPTAGFLFAFPLAAAAAGAIVRSLRSMRSQFAAGLLASSVATSLFLAMGAIWLEHLLHLNAMATWRLAIAPFLPGEAYKAGTAACFYATLHRWRRA